MRRLCRVLTAVVALLLAVPSVRAQQPTPPAPDPANLEVQKVKDAKHAGVEVHVYPSGHGFNCDERGSYDAASAKLARERTLAHFRKNIG